MRMFKKAFIGVTENPAMIYNIQNIFNMKGYFSTKVTPLGENLCLIKEMDEGEIKAHVVDGIN